MSRELIDGEKIVCVSGGFDPIHIGHVRMIQDPVLHSSTLG